MQNEIGNLDGTGEGVADDSPGATGQKDLGITIDRLHRLSHKPRHRAPHPEANAGSDRGLGRPRPAPGPAGW